MEVILSIELIKKRQNNIRIFGNKFVEENKNLEISINGNKKKLTTYYKLENEINTLVIKFIDNNITNIGHMFEGCKDFEYIDISWPDTSLIKMGHKKYKDYYRFILWMLIIRSIA